VGAWESRNKLRSPTHPIRNVFWLAEAARVISMSYYVPLPKDKVEASGIVWDCLNAVLS
jgi:hypothetical protein